MRLRYRGQVVLAFSALLIVGGGIATVLLSRWISEQLEGAVLEEVHSFSRNLATWSEDAVLTENRIDLQRLLRATKDSNDSVVYVYAAAATGVVLAHTFDEGFPQELGRVTAGRAQTLLDTEAGPVVDISAPVLGGRGGEIHVGYSRKRSLAVVDKMRVVVWLIAMPIALVGVIAVWVVSGIVTRPAERLTDVVRRLGAGDAGARVEARFSGEFGALANAFNVMADNLEKQRSELRYVLDYNQRLIDGLGQGLFVVDANERITYANRELAREHPDVVGSDCHTVICGCAEHCEDCLVIASRAANEVRTETRQGADGRWHEQTAIPFVDEQGGVSTIVTRRDVSAAVRLREQLTQHEKLAAIGELAAVVAHEVANPLDGMHSLVRLVRDDAGLCARSRRHLEMVEEGLDRMEMIVRRLITFTVDAAEPSLTTTAGEQVERTLEFLGETLEQHGVRVSVEADDGCPVEVDPNRLPQVIVNLVLNAVDAMPDGGRIRIRTVCERGGIRIAFEDEGPGVPEAMRERIFRPFFTTKGAGRGTGLGLAVSRRIVEGHGGSLTVREADGGGAAFDVWLPCAEGACGDKEGTPCGDAS